MKAKAVIFDSGEIACCATFEGAAKQYAEEFGYPEEATLEDVEVLTTQQLAGLLGKVKVAEGQVEIMGRALKIAENLAAKKIANLTRYTEKLRAGADKIRGEGYRQGRDAAANLMAKKILPTKDDRVIGYESVNALEAAREIRALEP